MKGLECCLEFIPWVRVWQSVGGFIREFRLFRDLTLNNTESQSEKVNPFQLAFNSSVKSRRKPQFGASMSLTLL